MVGIHRETYPRVWTPLWGGRAANRKTSRILQNNGTERTALQSQCNWDIISRYASSMSGNGFASLESSLSSKCL